NPYRVTGPFASMNTGGAYIEVFLALAFPMLLVWVLTVGGQLSKWFGVLLVLTCGYAMLVTFSRGGYGGLSVALLVVIVGLSAGRMLKFRRQWLLLGGLILVLVVAAVPALTTGFAKQRLSQAAGDFQFRLAHWQQALELMGDGIAPALVGVGFGRYPDLYLFSDRTKTPPGTYKVIDQDGARSLRLGNGEAVFLDQRVAVRPDTHYRLSLRLRTTSGQAKISVPLCEKALLYSFTCVWTTLTPTDSQQGWQRLEAEVQSARVGRGGRWPHGPTVLSLYNAGRSVVDIDDLSLTAPDGRELIANGGFDAGAERWLFVADQDLAWHIHEQFVETYFAQGLLGLVALIVLLTGVARVLWSAIRAGRIEAVAFAAALAGFLSVGLLGSTLDAARTALLFYFVAFAGAILVRGGELSRRQKSGKRRGRIRGRKGEGGPYKTTGADG
ncbi:MAG: O-antigen ligase family protein, partial [Thiohalocapsa sp.]